MKRIKKIIASSLLFLFCLSSSAQTKDYSTIDKFAKKAPIGISRHYKLLTHYLTDRYSTEDEKVRSISTWILNNIRYDIKMYSKDKRKKLKPNQILRRKKAICQGYSDLFAAMCAEVGIDARVVVGYDKGGSYEFGDIFVRDDHAWNAVNVEGGWQLIDLTWSAGYLRYKRQTFRRYLYYYLRIPFKQKYKFVKEPTYKYYYTNPDTFAIDHLSLYPWWQLGADRPIEDFEKDTTLRYNAKDYVLAKPYGGSIPSIDISEEPVDYLNRANTAFEFNNKNYRTLAEGKAVYAYKWFYKTKKSEAHEDSLKIEIYDSCKTLIDEAKKDIAEYIKYSALERNLRREKNKKYNQSSKDTNKIQMKKIDDCIKNNYTLRQNINQQLTKLNSENKKIERERKNINKNTIPEKKKSSQEVKSKIAEYESKYRRWVDSLSFYKNDINMLDSSIHKYHQQAQEEKPLLDEAFEEDIRLIYQISVWKMFFNWNYKFYGDSLEADYRVASSYRDSLHKTYIIFVNQEIAIKRETINKSQIVRNLYRDRLKFEYKYFSSCLADDLDSINIVDSCLAIKREWLEYDKEIIQCNKVEIEKLKKDKVSLNKMNKKFRREKKYLSKKNKVERRRYRLYNWYYLWFFKNEKRKAVRYFKNLSKFKEYIQGEMSRTKERIKREKQKQRQ